MDESFVCSFDISECFRSSWQKESIALKVSDFLPVWPIRVFRFILLSVM